MKKTKNDISMIVADDYQNMSAMAAECICRTIEQKPDLSMIIATDNHRSLRIRCFLNCWQRKKFRRKVLKL